MLKSDGLPRSRSHTSRAYMIKIVEQVTLYDTGYDGIVSLLQEDLGGKYHCSTKKSAYQPFACQPACLASLQNMSIQLIERLNSFRNHIRLIDNGPILINSRQLANVGAFIPS